MRREVFQTAAPPKLRIQLASGDVRLDTTDAPETVVEIEGPHEDDAKILQRGDEIVVEVGKKLFGAGRSHHVRVSSPHGAGIDANVASADIAGRGRFGPVEVNTASGDVSLEHVDGRLSVNTASGDVDVERVEGEVKINSASGDVTLGESESDVRIRSASGDQEIRSAAAGRLELQSASGDVVVGIRRGSRAWIDASSMSGDMRSELELSDEPPASDGPSVEVKARTMSGDVTIRRA
jgi:hypothetical protein